MDWKIVVASLVSLISGGAFGALINEGFRKRRSRTQRIPLIERVNRAPVSRELRGIKLFREVNGVPVEIRNVHQYQMTLRNTTEDDLRGMEIHFEFSGAALDAWCSRTKIGRIELLKVDSGNCKNDKLCARWKFPQLPSKDSVEFSFQVFEPYAEGYEVALYETNNRVIEKTGEDRAPGSNAFLMATVAFVSPVVGFITWALFGRVDFYSAVAICVVLCTFVVMELARRK